MSQKYFLSLLLLTVLCTSGRAQNQVIQVFGPDYYAEITDADLTEGGNGWAVGNCGLYLKTTNGGETWDDISDRFDEESTYISCLPGTNCQTIFRTVSNDLIASFNGGQTWETVLENERTGNFDYSIPGIIFSWRDREDVIITSSDNGQSWSVVNLSLTISNDLLILSPTEFGYFNGETFYLTTDGGQTFTTGGTLDQPASVATVANNGDLYAVDRFTKMWKSTDKGLSWTLHNERIFQYTVHNGLWMDEADVLHYITFLGIHVVSADGGLSWEAMSSGPRQWSARGYKRIESGHLAFGGGNSLHRFDPTDNTYEYLLGDVHPIFITMDFSPDGTTAYAATRDGLLYKSADGGKNWSYTGTTIPGDPIDLIARSADDILYLGKNSRLLASNDGGASFTNVPLDNGLTSFNDGTLEPAGNDEYFIMDIGTFGRIKANGEVVYASEITGGGTDIYFLDDDKGFRYGRHSLLRTLDGGRTWTEPTVDGSISFSNFDMHFVDESYGILLGSTTFETHDGGASWSSVNDIRAVIFAFCLHPASLKLFQTHNK